MNVQNSALAWIVLIVALSQVGCGKPSRSTPRNILHETLPLRSLPGLRGPIPCVAFSPDNQRVAAGDQHGIVICWDNIALRNNITIIGKGDVQAVAFLSDSDTLLIGHASTRQLRVVDLPRSKELLIAKGNTVAAFAGSRHRDIIAVGGWDKTIDLWKFGREAELLGSLQQPSSTASLSVSPDGELLAAGCSQTEDGIEFGTVLLWNIKSQTMIRQRSANANVVCWIGNSSLATGGLGDIEVLDTATLAPQYSLPCEMAHVRSMVATPDYKYLIVGGGTGRTDLPGFIECWDLSSRTCRTRMACHDMGGVLALAVSPDGKMLASTGYDDVVNIWDLRGLDK